MIIQNPGNKKPYNKLWGFLSVDKDGNEGICCINTPLGPQVAITGELKILKMYENIIRSGMHEARDEGLKIVLAEFSRTKTEEIQ